MSAVPEMSGTYTPVTPQLAGSLNDWTIFSLLVSRFSLTCPELAKLTGLSKPTVYQSLSRLSAKGLVEHTGVRSGGVGPRSKIYGVVPGLSHAAGIYVTPQIAKASISNVLGETIGGTSIPLSDRSAMSMIRAVREAFTGALGEAGLEPQDINRTVIGVPGPVSRDGKKLLKTPALPDWEADSTPNLMRKALGTNFQYENDANLAAIAEQQDPAVASVENFILLWVGEGVGCAIVTHGILNRGFHGLAGEIDNIVTSDGEAQRAKKFHTTVDSQSFVRLATEFGVSSGNPLTTMSFACSLQFGDRGVALVRAYAQRLAAGLATLVSVVDPGLIVLSGELLAAGGHVLSSSTELALHRMAADRPAVSVSISRFAGSSVIQGAVKAGLEGIRSDIRESFLVPARSYLLT
ncbi:ROK family transcriptional regulator [Streptomyces sp. NPDC088270]|uniref:ROK family transcriptional regulator n=1 Tax=Streptomyces sp. NPDC088270 TaxID=3160990 RepID=UPI003444A5CB